VGVGAWKMFLEIFYKKNDITQMTQRGLRTVLLKLKKNWFLQAFFSLFQSHDNDLEEEASHPVLHGLSTIFFETQLPF
jgi:hypothetical protein